MRARERERESISLLKYSSLPNSKIKVYLPSVPLGKYSDLRKHLSAVV